jgi:hypothetical protein
MRDRVSQSGKGSHRRGGKEEERKYREGWDLIFGKKTKPKKEKSAKPKKAAQDELSPFYHHWT